jgi:hypothetical protein
MVYDIDILFSISESEPVTKLPKNVPWEIKKVRSRLTPITCWKVINNLGRTNTFSYYYEYKHLVSWIEIKYQSNLVNNQFIDIVVVTPNHSIPNKVSNPIYDQEHEVSWSLIDAFKLLFSISFDPHSDTAIFLRPGTRPYCWISFQTINQLTMISLYTYHHDHTDSIIIPD